MKNFSEFTDILKEHSDKFSKDALDTIEKATVNDVLDRNTLIELLPALNISLLTYSVHLHHLPSILIGV